MLKYAGIGSRQTPDAIIQLMILIAKDLAPKWLLRSGFAEGADAAFHYGAEVAKGKFEIFLPWAGFHNAPKNDPRFFVGGPKDAEAYEVASMFHPAWDKCNQYAKALHTRNVYQIAGLHLDDKVDMVVCWTPNASGSGGTGQALRIAKYLGIPIFDLADPKAFDKLVEFVDMLEKRQN